MCTTTRNLVALLAALLVTLSFGSLLASDAPEPPAKTGESQDGDSAKVEAATRAAREWLALVDAGKYAESWDGASKLFKGAVEKEVWVGQLDSVRTPLGAKSSRKVRAASHETELPGAPDGSYVVIVFETSFANKAAAIETVTPMLDPDGVYRVSGYFIR
jgi:hypothetical protein